jgi:hypothetical protein
MGVNNKKGLIAIGARNLEKNLQNSRISFISL